jgi:hypothetical protein
MMEIEGMSVVAKSVWSTLAKGSRVGLVDGEVGCGKERGS